MKILMVKIFGITVVISVLVIVFAPSVALAHRSGCHRWHSCPSDTGSYVCGDLGYYSECPSVTSDDDPQPSSVYVAPPTTVHVPVITKKEDAKVEGITRTVRVVPVKTEYPSYEKIIDEGSDGEKKTVTTITMTDGVETSRSAPVVTITRQSVSKVVQKGIRSMPLAVVSSAKKSKIGWFNSHQNEVDLSGKAPKNVKLYLRYNSKFISSTRTDSSGSFTFKNIPKTINGMVGIYKDRGSTTGGEPDTDRISEPTLINASTSSIKTEYSMIHR